MGIVERVKEATRQQEVADLLAEMESYKYISGKTSRRANRSAVKRLNQLYGAVTLLRN